LGDWRQKAEGRRQKAEGRRQKAEGRRQKAEGGRQKAEGRRRKAEGRRQKAEGGRRETEVMWVWTSKPDFHFEQRTTSKTGERRRVGLDYEAQPSTTNDEQGTTNDE